MKKMNVLVATALVALSVSATSCDSKKSANLKSAVDSASYAIGVANGAMFKENLHGMPGEPVNVDVLLAGFEAAMKGDSANFKITPEQAQTYLQTYFVEAQAKESAAQKEAGDKFLAENKKKAGVVTTESGLQYKVITEGTGVKPTADDTVKVHYTGKTLEGKVFDSSVERGEPQEFVASQVIKGWTEGLQIMPAGSKYIFWIPAELAYGDRAAGPDIKPNSTLEFEVELLEVKKK
ncbi:FKBP-type peptidyl-prolyl cis-trans isomerase [Parabacteroides sp. Marseille-P3160]|uniref:FKBP-type peptidyl-prolyl cis-trans isomerase n=1 Tax=Parabacteroides sp. Marseille-P3160 TaxID=1917887 RepID=UPI0009B9390B|nr:FKBP-type peptidyl-prolyl cis-trans isomerase [Parabacteroides sp. Marseille-P3160]